MPSKKEIRARTVAVQSVQKITKSMEMIAAAKLKRTKERMEKSRPYISSLSRVIQSLISTDLGYVPTCFVERDVKKVGILVVGSELGLCGSLNVQLFRKVIAMAESFEKKNISVCFILVGTKAVEFFSKYSFEILAQKTGLTTAPSMQDLIGLCHSMIQAFESGTVDAFYMAYNQFVSTTVQIPEICPLLPLSWFAQTDKKNISSETIREKKWDYIYESNQKQLLDSLLMRSLEALIYQHVIETFSCVQASRMCSMQNASESARDLLDELKLEQHKLRQSQITQELMEIMSGATVINA